MIAVGAARQPRYVLVFLANVSPADAAKWLESSGSSFLQAFVLKPILMAFGYATLTTGVLCCNPHVQDMVRDQWILQEDPDDSAPELHRQTIVNEHRPGRIALGQRLVCITYAHRFGHQYGMGPGFKLFIMRVYTQAVDEIEEDAASANVRDGEQNGTIDSESSDVDTLRGWSDMLETEAVQLGKLVSMTL